jgi:hypothetical protein
MGAHAMVMSVPNAEDLRGLELAGVAFVRDYVELLFDGPIVRCYAPPEVVTDAQAVRFPEEGSRDALCNLIGAEVTAVDVGDHGLSIEFDGKRNVRVDFSLEWAAGREAAEFVPLLNGRLAPEQKLVW